MLAGLLKAILGSPENTLSQRNYSLWAFPGERGARSTGSTSISAQ